MAVVPQTRHQLWSALVGATSHSQCPTVNALPAGYKDDVVSASEDSSLSTEECNVAKAARIEGPSEGFWGGHTVTAIPAVPEAPTKPWTARDADAFYNVSRWSEGYFRVSEEGLLCATPSGDASLSHDLEGIVDRLAAQGLHTPLILRFTDIIGERIAKLNAAFAVAARRCCYPGRYQGVFPVKCNHDPDVVSAVLEFGGPYGFGLEVGSKAELLLAMAMMAETLTARQEGVSNPTGASTAHVPAPLLVCNGYKDLEYVELALRCSQLGANVVVVMEQPEEVNLAITVATNAPPSAGLLLGIRAKLATAHAGHWGSTSGDRAKFGLSTRQIVDAVRRLSGSGVLPRLAMLHFHVGSQMSALGAVRDTLAEGANLYAELVKMRASGMRYLDVGGGLAIDYDGSASEAHTSRAYTLESYATAVVGAIAEVCCLRNIPAPTIVSESGRALASHHSVVIFDVVNHNRQQSTGVAKEVPSGTSTGGVHIGGGHNGGAIPRRPLTELSSFGSVIPFGSSPPGGVCSPTAGGTVPLRTSSGVISPLASASVASSGVLHSPLQRFSLGCAVPDVLGTAENRHPATTSKAAIMLRMLRETLDSMTPGDALSLDHAVHDAEYFKGESLRAFKQGAVGLEERAAVDALVDEIKHKAAELGQMGGGGQRPHVTTLHINLSVFRSAVDTWAIGQVFPIVPLQRLNERPDMHAVLVDLTCDSDGKIDAFINPTGGPPLTALPLHSPGSNSKRPYRLAMFLAGVYQETMGSMHNLFGTLNSATVRLRKGAPAVRQRSFSEAGDTGGSVSVLSEVNHSMQSMPSAPSSQSLSSDGAYSDCGGGFGEHSDASASVVVVPEYAKKPGGGMFGGTQVESVEFKVERVTVGESAACVLTRAGHDPRAILTRTCALADKAAAEGRLDPGQRDAVMECIMRRLGGYTYMRDKED